VWSRASDPCFKTPETILHLQSLRRANLCAGESGNCAFERNGGRRNSSGKKESASHAINLLNRLEQLKLQKEELQKKRRIIFTNENVENVVRIIDAEMEKVQSELAKIAIKTESDTNK
jgi:hypothetical protein